MAEASQIMAIAVPRCKNPGILKFHGSIQLPLSIKEHNSNQKYPFVVSVTVTFNPDAELLFRQLRALSGQVEESVVVDNHSGNIGTWEGGTKDYSTLIQLPKNSGIGLAQNCGIKYALNRGATHVLLLDHDSIPEPGLVLNLLRAEEELGALSIDVAALGPMLIDPRNSSRSKFIEAKSDLRNVGPLASAREVDFLISSGTLIRSAALVSIGLMNQEFFIDHVDTDWCLRARSKGYRIFGVPSASLQHRLGDYVVRFWFGRWRNVSVHSPLRNYYMSRNTVFMLKSLRIPRQWRWRLAIRLFLHMLFFSLLISPRGERIFYMFKGIWHGVLGVAGQLGKKGSS